MLSLLNRLRQFARSAFQRRQAETRVGHRQSEPRLRVQVGTFACHFCNAEFLNIRQLRQHECTEREAA